MENAREAADPVLRLVLETACGRGTRSEPLGFGVDAFARRVAGARR
jgi:hypothetical protein